MSLFAQLHMGLGALRANQYGLEMTGDNLANVSTPGFSRRQLTLSTTRPQEHRSVGQLGRGVDAGPIQALRSRFLEARFQVVSGAAAKEQARHDLLSGIEAIFAEDTALGFQDEMTALFNSFGALAANPESIPLREQVLARGDQLIQTMQQAHRRLDEVTRGINSDIPRGLVEVNQKLERIAELNAEITRIEARIPANAQRDERALLLVEVSELVGIASYENADGSVGVTLKDGTALVVADRFEQLQASATGPSGNMQINLKGTDVTSLITEGRIGGALSVREQLIPDYQRSMDTIANEIIQQVNTLHTGGFALDGATTGGDFFVAFTPPSPTDPTGATMAMAIDPALRADTTLIAAAGVGGAPGDGDQAQAIFDLSQALLLSGGSATLTDFYSGFTFQLGSDVVGARSSADALGAVTTQINNQRLSVSAVSLDEEAVALVQYQRGYEAAARFIRVVDEITQTALGIGA